jgi:hypothetical protein
MSAPAKLRSEVAQHTVEDVRVVVDAELVRDSQQYCVCGRDRLVLGEFLHKLIRFPGVRLSESGGSAIEVTDLVLATGRATKIRPVQVADDGKNASADRDPRLTFVTGGRPSVTEPLDLLSLELVERDTGVLSQ